MTPPRGTCEFCHEAVEVTQTAAFPVSGWEVEREQGGANRILDRKRAPDRIAHASCVEHHVKHGDQESLL